MDERKKPVINTFSLIQLKKFIGKQLIKVWPRHNIPTQELKNNAYLVKTKMMAAKKPITITTFTKNGIWYVIEGIVKFQAMSKMSYKEISAGGMADVKIRLVQYEKLTNKEIHKFMVTPPKK